MKVLVCVTGSIAAYKAAELVRRLVKSAHEVRVVMTPAATQFVSPLTFQTLSRNEVHIEEFEKVREWNPKHISLAKWPDAIIVAPATANTLAKMRAGMADNLLTGVLLAARAPIIAAPAMNDGMWENAATRENIEVLASRGVRFAAPEEGELACNSTGKGRMAPLDTILSLLHSIK